MYLDFKLDPGATMTQPVTDGWNGFIYVLKGQGQFGGGDSWTDSDAHHTLVLGPGDHVQAKNTVSHRSSDGVHTIKLTVIRYWYHFLIIIFVGKH